MENFVQVAIVVGIFLLGLALSTYVRHRRTEAVKKIAAELGFEFLGHGNEKLPILARNLDLFSKGRSQQIRNLVRTQREGATIFVFDYQYQTGSGKNRRTHYQTVVLFESNTLALPRFFLVPENLFHKIGNLFGYRDIDFCEHPRFSRKYLLRGELEDSIRRIFNDRVISLYESRQGVSTEGLETILAYYYAYQSAPPKLWKDFLQEALDTYRLFKSYH